MNAQAEKLNSLLNEECPWICDSLSKIGKEMYFPKEGIIKQTQEAKGMKYNATIGIALDEDNDVMILESLKEGYGKCISKSSFNYAPTGGIMELRQIWKQKMLEKNPSIKSNISLPIVCGGLTHAINVAASLFIEEGDEIIIPDMYWGNYKLLFETLHSGKIKTYNTFKDGGMDIISMENVFDNKTGKLIVLFNFPNNPSGYSPTKEEARSICESLKKQAEAGKKIIAIIDDAYFGLNHDDSVYGESIFGMLSEINENIIVIKIDGVSKEDYAWGLRIGFMTFSGNFSEKFFGLLEEKVLGILRASISNVSSVNQQVMISAYLSKNIDRERKINNNILKQRFDEIKNLLDNHEYNSIFEPLPYNSGYFMSIRLKGGKAEEIRKILLEKYSTGVISIGEDILRIAYSSIRKDDIKTIFSNIAEAIKNINN